MNNEVWKDIPGYEGIYQVSDLGRVKSFKRKSLAILTPFPDKRGYLTVDLRKYNKRKVIKIHRLVMLSFVGESELQVNHKNGIKSDNKLENLEYCTNLENMRHSYKTGLRNQKGEKHPSNKLTEIDVIEIRKLIKNGKYDYPQIAKLYNVSRTAIGDIKTGRTWKHLKEK